MGPHGHRTKLNKLDVKDVTLGSNPGRGLVARLVGHWDGRCFRELTINYLPSTSTVIHSILASTIYYHIDYELIFSFTLRFNYTYSP